MLHSFASTKRAKNHQGNIFIVRTVGSDLIAYALFPRANIPTATVLFPCLCETASIIPVRNTYGRVGTQSPFPSHGLPPSLLLSPFYFCHNQGGRKIDNLFSTTNPSASQKVSTGRDTVTDVYIPERAPTPILERRPFSKSNRPGERRWRNGVFLKGPESFRVYRFSGYLRVCPWQDSPQVSLPVREERRGPVARNERKTRRRGESERERGNGKGGKRNRETTSRPPELCAFFRLVVERTVRRRTRP